MKYLFYLLLIGLFISSCSENISDNSPALQGFVDNELYFSNDAFATQDVDGRFLIEGLTQNQNLSLHISSGGTGTYHFDASELNYATFVDPAGTTYFSDPRGSGTVVVSNFNQEAKTLSGSFEFVAFRPQIQDSVIVKHGVFFEVPFTTEQEVVEIPEELPTGPCNAGTFVTLIDGNPIQQGNNLCVMAVEFQEQIVITATDPDDEIRFYLPITVGEGQHSLITEGFMATYKDGIEEAETALRGNVIIIEHNVQTNLIKGTFSFLTQNHVISIGSFNVTY